MPGCGHAGGGLSRAVACLALALAACLEVAPEPSGSTPPAPPPVLAGVFQGSGTGSDHVAAPPPRVTVESPLPGVLTFTWPTCADGTARLARGDVKPSDPYTFDVLLQCDSGFYFTGSARFQGGPLDLAVALYKDVGFTTNWYGEARFQGVWVPPGS